MLFLVAAAARFFYLARLGLMRIVTAGARLMTLGCSLVLGLMTSFAVLGQVSTVRFVTGHAGAVVLGCGAERGVASAAFTWLWFLRVMRQTLMTGAAVLVPGVVRRAIGLRGVAIAAKLRLFDGA